MSMYNVTSLYIEGLIKRNKCDKAKSIYRIT